MQHQPPRVDCTDTHDSSVITVDGTHVFRVDVLHSAKEKLSRHKKKMPIYAFIQSREPLVSKIKKPLMPYISNNITKTVHNDQAET